MAFDITSAKPVQQRQGFDISTAKPVDLNQMESPSSGAKPSFWDDLKTMAQGDPVLGAIENMLAFGTAAVAEPISGYAGLISGAEAVPATQEALTYQPRSAAGKDIQRGVGDVLAPVGEAISSVETALGDTAFEATGSPAIAAGAATIPTAALELIGLKGARKAKAVTPKQITKAKDPALSRTGIRATTGEVSQNLPQQKAEQFLLEQASEGGEQLRGYKLAQSREIRDYLEGVAPQEIDNVGDTVKQALELRESSAKFKRKQAYNKLAELTKDLDVKLNTQVLSDALPDAGELRDFAATNTGQYNALTNLLTEFGVDLTPEGIKRASDQGIDITELSVGNAERLRKRLNAIERADPTGNTSRITGPIKSALDNEFDTAARALQESGSEDVSRAAKNARQSQIALKTEFDEKGLTKQLIDTKGYQSRLPKIEESRVYEKLAANNTSIEEFDRVVKSLDRAASKGKRAKDQIKSRMMLDLIDSGFSAKSRKINGEQVFGANAFLKRFEQLEPKLKSIMTDQEFKRLKDFTLDAKDLVPPSGALPKGSAGFFVDALSKAGFFAMMDKVPYAGTATANFLKKVGKTSQDLKTFNKAVAASPELKDAVNLLATDYPSLAVALGVPLLREDDPQAENQN